MFFTTRSDVKNQNKVSLPVQRLHQLECKACPLDKARVHSGKMEPTGSDKPTLYVLGEAPGVQEDKEGKQFVGKSGRLLRKHLPNVRTRFNNVIRTHPPINRDPDPVEIECCRPSIERDIIATKPKVILGTGAVPLKWALNQKPISAWRGRVVPINIGGHVCWFAPVFHPSYIGRVMNDQKRDGDAFLTVFKKDLAMAASYAKLTPRVFPGDEASLMQGIELREDRALALMEEFVDDDDIDTIAIDIETNRTRPYAKDSRILSVSVSDGKRTAAVEWEGVVDVLYRLLRSDRMRHIIAHNLSFELEWLAHAYGEDVLFSSWDDTMLQAYVLDERVGAMSLDAVAIITLGLPLKGRSSLDRAALETYPISRVLRYNAIDAKYTWHVYEAQRGLLKNNPLQDVYQDQVQRVPSLVWAQLTGLCVSQKEVGKHRLELLDQEDSVIDAIKGDKSVVKFSRETHSVFNPASPTAVGNFLYWKGIGQVGEPGAFKTGEDVLSEVDDPVAAAVLMLRGLSKLRSTYVDPVKKGGKHLWQDGRIHTNYNMTFTDTGRLSSDGPNMQNWPKRKDSYIRSVVVPPPGCMIVSVDYGQIEYRVLGMASRDKHVLWSLDEQHDVHGDWATKLIDDGKRPDDFGKVRSEIKNALVFPLFYGAFPESIAHNLALDLGYVRKLVQDFWSVFQGVRDWQETLIEFYDEHGYVECLSGRRRRGILSRNKIFNSPIQGTASDIVVDAMRRLALVAYEKERHYLHPVMNIHDDLTFYIPEDVVDEAISEIVEQMVSIPYEWCMVPVSVEVSIGNDWANLEDVGTYYSDEAMDVAN